MSEYIGTLTNPTVAAVSVLLELAAVLALVIGDRPVGVRRLAGV